VENLIPFLYELIMLLALLNPTDLLIQYGKVAKTHLHDVDVEKLWAQADASMPISSILLLAKLSNTITN